jgi:hypothetical protein
MTYLTVPDVEIEQLEHELDSRFLSLNERERIHDLQRAGVSIRGIARDLSRSPWTITREFARNSQQHVGCLPYGAHRLAASRRAHPKICKLERDGPMKGYVEAGLRHRWSPEQISGRLVKDFPQPPSNSTSITPPPEGCQLEQLACAELLGRQVVPSSVRDAEQRTLAPQTDSPTAEAAVRMRDPDRSKGRPVRPRERHVPCAHKAASALRLGQCGVSQPSKEFRLGSFVEFYARR